MKIAIFNLGTQEPRLNLAQKNEIQPQYFPVGRPADHAAEQRFKDLLGARHRPTFYERTRTLTSNDGLHDRLIFPFIESVLLRCQQDNLWPLDLILLAATDNRGAGVPEPAFENNSPLDPTDPLHWDTIFAAQLVERRLKKGPQWAEWAKQCTMIVLPFDHEPHLYQHAHDALDYHLRSRKGLENNIRDAETIVISQSPGLPMINASLLNMGLRLNRRAVRPVQVGRLDENDLLAGVLRPDLIYPAPEHFIRVGQLRAQWDDLMRVDHFAGLAILAEQIPPFEKPEQEAARKRLLDQIIKLDGMWALRPDEQIGLIDHYRLLLDKLERCFERMGYLDAPAEQPLEAQVLNDAVYLTALAVERLKHLFVALLECISLQEYTRPCKSILARIRQGLSNFGDFKPWLNPNGQSLWRDLTQFDKFNTWRNSLVHHLRVPERDEFLAQICETAKALGWDGKGSAAGFVLRNLRAMLAQLESSQEFELAARGDLLPLPSNFQHQKRKAEDAVTALVQVMEA